MRKILRRMATAFTLLGILLGAWAVAGFFLFVNPAVDQPARADALVVLAPPLPTGRLAYAEQLMSEGYATTLVISIAEDRNGVAPTQLCQEDRAYTVLCFTPNPVTTQGEARAIQRLAEEHHWRSINVVSNDFHITRARMIIRRCYSQDLQMLAVRQNISWRMWAFRGVYETAALVKAGIDRSC